MVKLKEFLFLLFLSYFSLISTLPHHKKDTDEPLISDEPLMHKHGHGHSKTKLVDCDGKY